MNDKVDIGLAEHIACLIGRNLSGEMTPEEEHELQDWRDAHPANEALFRKLANTDYIAWEYRRLLAVDASRPLADMRTRVGRRRGVAWRRLGWQVAGAAVAMLCLSWGIFLLRQEQQEGAVHVLTEEEETALYAAQIHPGKTEAVLTLGSGEQVSLGADVRKNEEVMRETKKESGKRKEPKLNCLSTPRGGEFRITLEDGTEVWLNAETQLIYPDTFNMEERRVKLRGEAYFKVARNEGKPFFVETDGQLVRVYGTEFNMRAYEEDEDVFTTLVSGKVALQPLQGNSAELVLKPGRQAVFDKGRQAMVVRSVDTESVTSWRKGMFVFEEQTLGQIMQDLSRWYNFSYEFREPALRATVFMGTVPRYGDFKEILNILEKSGGLKFRMKDRTVIISDK